MSVAEVFGAVWWCVVVVLGPGLVWYLFRAAYMAGRKDGRRAERQAAERDRQNSAGTRSALRIVK